MVGCGELYWQPRQILQQIQPKQLFVINKKHILTLIDHEETLQTSKTNFYRSAEGKRLTKEVDPSI